MTLYARFFLWALIGAVWLLPLVWASDAASSAKPLQTVREVSTDNEELLSQLRTLDWTNLRDDEVPALGARIAGDEVLLAEALAVLRQAQDEQKVALSQVLAASRSLRVHDAAVQWASDPNDGYRRADGWLLLRLMPPTSQTFQLALQRLDREADETALAQMIWSVRRIEVPRPNAEAATARKLHRLSRHPNARVRMASIQMLADWDRSGRFVMDDLLRLLQDKDPQVRLAAVGASAIHGQSSKVLKNALLRLATQSAEDLEVRSAALINLERFSFTQREFDVYKAAMGEVFKESGR